MITIRLWHYKLLPFLPNKMLVSEWRECIAIKRQWEKGTLKHRLVSYVMDYDKKQFLNYVCHIETEMKHRKIKHQNKYLFEIKDFCKLPLLLSGIHYPEHNNRYLKQCLYNLQEKADRGIITPQEWQLIYYNFKEYLD